MPAPRASTAYEWRERLTLCPYPFHPESTLSNQKALPSPLGVAPSQALAKNRRCPRTSSHDRSALATPDFRCASSLRLVPGHRCRFRWRTSESPAPARFGRGVTNEEPTILGVLSKCSLV